MDVRQVIVDRLKQTGKTRYWLAKTAGMRMPTVYDYIKGRSDMTGDYIGRLMDALGLSIVPAESGTPKRGVPDSKRPRRAGTKRKRA